MPNHIINQIIFRDRETMLKVAKAVQQEGQPLGSVDFNKIIPMPPSLMIEAGSRMMDALKFYTLWKKDIIYASGGTRKQLKQAEKKWDARKDQEGEFWKLGKQAYENIMNHGFFNWYDWSVQNWGTKWNAYNPASVEYGSTLEFSTAWEAPFPIIEQLSKQFPETIVFRWADENMGHNVGELTLKNGELLEQNIPEEGTEKAFELAADIRATELSGFDQQQKPRVNDHQNGKSKIKSQEKKNRER